MKFLFYKPLKLSGSEDQIFFWSDIHFGHRCERWDIPLWKIRGFESIEDHDEGLTRRWNNLLTSESTVFCLGDFIFGSDTIQRFESKLAELNFNTIYIMPGNHCSGWKQVFEKQRTNVWYISNSKRVIFIPNYLEAVINKQPIVLSHYPLVSFNGQSIGSWMIHGHCHGKLNNTPIGQELYKAKITDVGVENCPSPVSLAELRNLFSGRNDVCFE